MQYAMQAKERVELRGGRGGVVVSSTRKIAQNTLAQIRPRMPLCMPD